jgi:hypothetical protein
MLPAAPPRTTLLFLLFDIEILLVYPYAVSSYNNSTYGLFFLIVFLLLLTAGFVFEFARGALQINSKQTGHLESSILPNSSALANSPTKRFSGRSKPKNLYTWPHRRIFYSTQNTTTNDPTVPARTYPNFDLDKVKILRDNRRKSGVYRLKNLINGKTYVGSSVNISSRLSKYYSLAGLMRDYSMLINRALLKYGYSSFSFEILEYCGKDETLKREDHYLKLLKPDYNIATDTLAPMLGRKHSAETL